MRNKVLIFIGGLFAGLVIGVLFSVAIKELIVQFKELHLTLNRINLKQSQLSQRLDSIQGKLVPDTKKPSSLPAQNNQKTNSINTSKTATSQDNAKSQNQLTTNSSIGKIAQDSDVVVMTNQLVSVLSVPLKKNDTDRVTKKNHETDSTLESMSDINDSKQFQNYRVEFWKSPLNYKGYKMSRGKIVLYGINPTTSVNLTMQNDNYYLLVNQNAYKVEYTDDYKPFDKVTDKAILKKVGL
ncbi:MAG TPA: hypothetical protein VK809_05720 [Bacteroidia bacterium]|jgi:hypothetical protein|nr:hypothetical protein [Bacteroidia bacterium]